jgi:hypothetical protein
MAEAGIKAKKLTSDSVQGSCAPDAKRDPRDRAVSTLGLFHCCVPESRLGILRVVGT